MPANVGGDFGHLHLVGVVVLLADVLEVMLPVKCYHRLAVLVQIQKPHLPPIIGSVLGFGLLAIMRWKHWYTPSVIGISRVPLEVFVSSMIYSMFRFR